MYLCSETYTVYRYMCKQFQSHGPRSIVGGDIEYFEKVTNDFYLYQ